MNFRRRSVTRARASYLHAHTDAVAHSPARTRQLETATMNAIKRGGSEALAKTSLCHPSQQSLLLFRLMLWLDELLLSPPCRYGLGRGACTLVLFIITLPHFRRLFLLSDLPLSQTFRCVDDNVYTNFIIKTLCTYTIARLKSGENNPFAPWLYTHHSVIATLPEHLIPLRV